MKTYRCYKSGGRDATTVKANCAYDAMFKFIGCHGNHLRGIASKDNPSQYATEHGDINVYQWG